MKQPNATGGAIFRELFKFIRYTNSTDHWKHDQRRVEETAKNEVRIETTLCRTNQKHIAPSWSQDHEWCIN